MAGFGRGVQIRQSHCGVPKKAKLSPVRKSQQKETFGPCPNLWEGGRCGVKDSSFKSHRGLRSKDSLAVDEASLRKWTGVMLSFPL